MAKKIKFQVELVAMADRREVWMDEKGKNITAENSVKMVTLKFPSGKSFTFQAPDGLIKEVANIASAQLGTGTASAKPKSK